MHVTGFASAYLLNTDTFYYEVFTLEYKGSRKVDYHRVVFIPPKLSVALLNIGRCIYLLLQGCLLPCPLLICSSLSTYEDTLYWFQ